MRYTHPRVESHDDSAREAHVGTWVTSVSSDQWKGPAKIIDAYWIEDSKSKYLMFRVQRHSEGLSFPVLARDCLPADPPPPVFFEPRLAMNPDHPLNIKE